MITKIQKFLCCTLSCVLSILGLSACSVKQERVKNEPPVIQKNVQPFATSFGNFPITQASVFLWPAGMSEEQAQSIVRQVNAASLEVDNISLELTAMNEETTKLLAKWTEQACVEKWSAEYDEFEEQVNSWKTSENPDEQKLIKACADNQERRKAITGEIAPKAAAVGALSEKVDRLVDPDPNKIENKKSIRMATSLLEILETDAGVKVNVKLDGFLSPTYSPSTENGQILNANFDINRRLLSFMVPEVNADNQPTGLIYVFLMERAPDLGQRARFSGDVRIVDQAGKILRYGSVRFDTVRPQ
jgi:hypothetical protein